MTNSLLHLRSMQVFSGRVQAIHPQAFKAQSLPLFVVCVKAVIVDLCFTLSRREAAACHETSTAQSRQVTPAQQPQRGRIRCDTCRGGYLVFTHLLTIRVECSIQRISLQDSRMAGNMLVRDPAPSNDQD